MQSMITTIQILILAASFSPLRAAAIYQQSTPEAQVLIQLPVAGQALQGDIVITGSVSVPDFAAYEVYFGYAADPTGTWFFLQRSTLPVTQGMLTHWDTTLITDGDYVLRLVVFHTNGLQDNVIIPGLRVRNYTPIETDTPTPPPPTDTPAPGTPLPPSATPTVTLQPSATPLPPTPTPLPTNPAILSEKDILSAVGWGSGVSVGLLALLGSYLGIRHYLRNRS
jgi:hypothetical protein